MSTNAGIKKIVLVGASGNLGAIILPTLLEAKAFEVTVLTRPSNTSSFPARVNVIRTSYTESELVSALKEQDAIVSAIGATGFQDQKVLIDAAIKAGVKRFIPSELSTNTLSEAVRQLVPVFEAKKVILDYLKEKESTGMTWTGLAVGALFDWGLHSGFLGFDIPNKKATIWDGGSKSFSLTNQSDVGKAIIGILEHPSETANQYLYVATVSTTQKAILSSLEEHSGQEWEIQDVKTDEQIGVGRQMISQGDFRGMFMLVQASGWGMLPGIRSNYAVDEKLANGTLGIADGSVDKIVVDVLKS